MTLRTLTIAVSVAAMLVACGDVAAQGKQPADYVEQFRRYLYPRRYRPPPPPLEETIETVPAIVPPVVFVPPAEPWPEIKTPTRPKAAPTAQPKVRAKPQQTERPKPTPQTESGFCLFPISCETVCSFARAGDNRRGTPCQNRLGLACIRSTCPDVLRKKR